MKILINDFIQGSNAPDYLKSPDLSEYYDDEVSIDIDFGENKTVNCIGIGYTDATTFTVTPDGGAPENVTVGASPNASGLYLLVTPFTNDVVNVAHNGSYVGRVALGFARSLGAAPTREAGFYSTESPRVTKSGGVIPGAGGYYGRRLAVDFRYNIDSDIFSDITAAMEYISKGYPWFMALTAKEQARIAPWSRLYASPADVELLLQSSVNRFLYSKQFDFYERF